MSDSYPDIKSVVVRVITNKPVRKTPYQVKGVFMRQYPNEDIIPMLDGTYRDRYLYPRVQVKILNEQIYLIGINEGVDSVISLSERLKSLDFGNITFDVDTFDINSRAFINLESNVNRLTISMTRQARIDVDKRITRRAGGKRDGFYSFLYFFTVERIVSL